MILQAVGTSSSFPVPDRNNSCMLLKSSNSTVLLDVGDGTARQLVKFGVDPCEIDAAVISHAHIDHSAGIFGILFWMKLSERTKDFTIYAPLYFAMSLKNFLPFMRIKTEALPFKLNILPLSNGAFLKNESLYLTAAGNNHLTPEEKEIGKFVDNYYSFSIIVQENGKKLIYTSDIQSLEHLKPFAAECELIVTEAAHISLNTIVLFATKNRIKNIALTHITPDFNTSSELSVPNGRVSILNDGDILRI